MKRKRAREDIPRATAACRLQDGKESRLVLEQGAPNADTAGTMRQDQMQLRARAVSELKANVGASEEADLISEATGPVALTPPRGFKELTIPGQAYF